MKQRKNNSRTASCGYFLVFVWIIIIIIIISLRFFNTQWYWYASFMFSTYCARIQESKVPILTKQKKVKKNWIWVWCGTCHTRTYSGPPIVHDHLLQFCHMAGFPRSSHLFFWIIWLACVWVIWKERNNQVFNQMTLDSHAISDKVKLLSFSWLKANMSSFAFAYHDWWYHPLSCMGVLM